MRPRELDRPNIVLVVFDTLRLDAVGCYATPPPWGGIETPVLDAFARVGERAGEPLLWGRRVLGCRRLLVVSAPGGLRPDVAHRGPRRRQREEEGDAAEPRPQGHQRARASVPR